MTTLPLATPDEIADYQAGELGAMLAAADAAVRSYCGWHIAPVVTEAVTVADGFLGNVLRLPSLHLTALSALVIDGTTVDLATLEIFDYGIVRKRAGYDWSWLASVGSPAAVATITHGYADTPGDVLAVIGSIASRAERSPDGVVRQQVGLVSTTFSQSSFNVAGGIALLDFEKDLLSKYRIPGAT